MNIYEMYGRACETAQLRLEDFEKTLELLNMLKSGRVPLEDLQVLPDGWRIERAAELPDNVVRFPEPDESD